MEVHILYSTTRLYRTEQPIAVIITKGWRHGISTELTSGFGCYNTAVNIFLPITLDKHPGGLNFQNFNKYPIVVKLLQIFIKSISSSNIMTIPPDRKDVCL